MREGSQIGRLGRPGFRGRDFDTFVCGFDAIAQTKVDQRHQHYLHEKTEQKERAVGGQFDAEDRNGKAAKRLAEALAKDVLSLPIYVGISEAQIRFVCDAVRDFYTN